jgi:hypothetical protein
MTWGRRLYPLFIAIFPIATIAVRNTWHFRPTEPLGAIAVAAGAVGIVYAIAYALLRPRLRDERTGDAAAFVTFVLVAGFYGFAVARVAVGMLGRAGGLAAAVAALVVVAAGVLLLRARGRALASRLPSLAQVGRALTVFSALALASTVVRVVEKRVGTSRALARSTLVRELARPVPVAAAAAARAGAADGRRRDVYILLLDAYASPEVYLDRYGFDNRAFADSLRALGFRVPASVRSNYAHTVLSFTSLLNFAHMRPLADVVDERSREFAPAGHLLEYNRAGRFLKERGYRVVFFPSFYYGPTRRSRAADVQYDPYPGFDLARAVRRSEYLELFFDRTPLRYVERHLRSYDELHVEHVHRTLDGVAALAARPERETPVFAVAHVLMPHGPVIVDSACTPRGAGVRESAVNQVRCVNRWTLATVRALLERSDPKPIIIVQGDHGPDQGDIGLVTPPTKAQLAERLRPFGAYHLPDGGAAAMPDSVSVVNVLRYVFGYYFDADLPPLPDRMYFSHWRLPYRMREVASDFTFVGADSATRPARAGVGIALGREW